MFAALIRCSSDVVEARLSQFAVGVAPRYVTVAVVGSALASTVFTYLRGSSNDLDSSRYIMMQPPTKPLSRVFLWIKTE